MILESLVSYLLWADMQLVESHLPSAGGIHRGKVPEAMTLLPGEPLLWLTLQHLTVTP